MAERALAHVEKIEWVKPIEGADNIEQIGVLGWACVAKKGEFQPGDLAVYIEIDSKCPADDERFAFLASQKKTLREEAMVPVADAAGMGTQAVICDFREETGQFKNVSREYLLIHE